jgi:ribosomal peptide maturation radical SAM protein 1
MLKISLINMPFATLRLPSIALTQLKSLAESRFGERVRVRILYLNQDFANYLGLEVYEVLNSLQASNAGLGDWLFRLIAFPEQADNVEAYLQRHFPHRDPVVEAKLRLIVAKRAGIERFLQRLLAKHQLDAEDVAGFTSMFAQNTASFAMARLIKARNPAVTTVIGGANCEAPMGLELARHVPALDFIFSGPGLVSFSEFLDRRLAGDLEGCHRIRGVLSKGNVPEKTPQSHNILGQELPIDVPVPLDYDDFLANLERNFPNGKVKPSLTFETSRGCWWGERAHCTFCGLNGGTMAYRAMPPAQALELFQSLFARYGGRCTYFESVDNIMPREYLTEVFPFVRVPQGSSIFYEVKADLKDREMEVLAKAGVRQIQPGIESLATSTLKLMHKGVTAFQNVSFLKNCLRFDINPLWNLLIGFPRETDEVYRKYIADLPLLVHLPPPSGAFPVRFDRYSPYFTRAGEYGLDLVPYDFYRYIYPFPEEVLADLAYYFEDRNYGADYLAQMVSWKDKLGRACARWAERWSGSDGRSKASLTLKRRGTGAVVHDTRSGEAVEHEADELGVRIIEFIDGNGWRVRDIAAHVGADEASVASQIDRFRRLGLIFTEGERLISLVVSPVARAAEQTHALTATGTSTAAAAAV